MRRHDPYLDLIARVGLWRPPVFVFGGFAEDARSELSARLAMAETIGFTQFEIYYEPLPGRPLVLNAEHNGLHIEVSIFDTDADGRPYFVAVSGEDETPCRIYLPSNAFTFPPSTIEGIPVRTVSPLALYQIRAGLVAIQAFGGPRPSDVTSQERLIAQFFADKSEDELAPEIQRGNK